MDRQDYMLTTVDNPYNPFTQFDNWYAFDEQSGYCSCGLLARLAVTSDELTEEQNQIAIDEAVNDILDLFPDLYTIVYPTPAKPAAMTLEGGG